MAINWNIPALANKIANDIPALRTLIDALVKWTVANSDTNVPTGAKRLETVNDGVQIQKYTAGSGWSPLDKLINNVDKVDGYDAVQGVPSSGSKEVIVVRDSQGMIDGDITGNASTASTASGLAQNYKVPIANGGTAAGDAASARANLGTNNASNISEGILATTYGGTGRNDGMATNVFLGSACGNTDAVGNGQLGLAASKNNISANSLIWPGDYVCTSCTAANNWPTNTTNEFYCKVSRYGNQIFQTARAYGVLSASRLFIRQSSDGGSSWSGWEFFSNGSYKATTEIYVASNGRDTNHGFSRSYPVRTLDRAFEIINSAQNPFTVTINIIDAGTYSLSKIGKLPNVQYVYLKSSHKCMDSSEFDSWMSILPTIEHTDLEGVAVYLDGSFNFTEPIYLRNNAYLYMDDWCRVSGFVIFDSKLELVSGLTIYSTEVTNGPVFSATHGVIDFGDASFFGQCSGTSGEEYNYTAFIEGNSSTFFNLHEFHEFTGSWRVEYKTYIRACRCPDSDGAAFTNLPGYRYALDGVNICEHHLQLGTDTLGEYLDLIKVFGYYDLGDGNPNYNTPILRILGNPEDPNAYNLPVVIGSFNGATYLGAGESLGNMPAQLHGDDVSSLNSENVCISADGSILFFAGCSNSGATYKRPLTLTAQYAYTTTPAAKDNTTKVATTAFCKDFIKALSVSGKTITYTKSTGTTGTITTQDTTYSVFTGATSSAAGSTGLVPAPAKAYNTRFLRGDKSWQTVSTSSDRRLKQGFADFPEEVLDAWAQVHWHQFKMNDEVEEKGVKAPIHAGLVVQDLQAVFKAHGLDACEYDMVLHDEWPARPASFDEEGRLVSEASPASDQWSLRYEQALAVEAAYQRRRADRAEARIASLEARLAAVEAKIA